MRLRLVRGGVVAFFVLFAAAVTWPGMIPGNRIFPLVFGLPLSMAWIAAWVVLSFLVLVGLDSAERKVRDRREKEGAGVGPGAAERERHAAEGDAR